MNDKLSLTEKLIEIENLSSLLFTLIDEIEIKKNAAKFEQADTLSKILKEKVDSFDLQFRTFYSESGI